MCIHTFLFSTAESKHPFLQISLFSCVLNPWMRFFILHNCLISVWWWFCILLYHNVLVNLLIWALESRSSSVSPFFHFIGHKLKVKVSLSFYSKYSIVIRKALLLGFFWRRLMIHYSLVFISFLLVRFTPQFLSNVIFGILKWRNLLAWLMLTQSFAVSF